MDSSASQHVRDSESSNCMGQRGSFYMFERGGELLEGECCDGTEGCIHWLVDNSAMIHDLEKLFGKLETLD